MLQHDVACNAAPQRGCKRQPENADEVVLVARLAHGIEGSPDRSHEDAKEIEDEK